LVGGGGYMTEAGKRMDPQSGGGMGGRCISEPRKGKGENRGYEVHFEGTSG